MSTSRAPVLVSKNASLRSLVAETLKHRIPPAPPLEKDFSEHYRTVMGLIAMRQAGIIRAVYCDQDRLYVVYPLPADEWVRVRTRWDLAAKAVQTYYTEIAKRKPAIVEAAVRARKRA